MHRFGRSELKWRDRLGGGFLVATILAMAVAWKVGTEISRRMGDASTQAPMPAGEAAQLPDPGGLTAGEFPVDLAAQPTPFSVYFLQAGAFRNPEGAQQHADALREAGFPARISADGDLHKVFVGAYMTRETATRVREEALTQHGDEFELFPVRVDVQGDPVVPASTAEVQGIYDQGIAALNGYLKEASAWWDSYAAGTPEPTDQLAAFAGQVASAAEQLRGQGGDAAASQFLIMADRVTANSAQIANLALSPDVGGENFRIAMDGYMALLDDYRAWTQAGG